MSSLHRLLLPLLPLCVFGPGVFLGCQNKSGGDAPTAVSSTGQGGGAGQAGESGQGGAGPGGGGGSGGGGGASPLANACAFKIAPRMEYKNYGPGTSVLSGADPHIRRVRRGLGGAVAVGAANRADPSTSLGVAWQTDVGTLASDIAWGTPGSDPSTWPATNRITGNAWVTPASSLNAADGDTQMHEVYVCGLAPATSYSYRVGGGPAGAEAWSDVHTFTTTPSSADATVTIALTGDSRGENGNAWQILQKRVFALQPTLQLFSGDMINLGPDQGEWGQWLDSAWKDDAGKLSALGQILTLEAHGNHDNHNTLYFSNMILPQDPDAFPKYTELFFSVDVGPVHIVVLDDLFVANNSSPDYNNTLGAWLDQDLGAANKNRANVPWLVAMHHHPDFSSSNHGQDSDVKRVSDFLTHYYDQYHVNLVVNGHDHNYERSKPLNGPIDNPAVKGDADFSAGTVYVVCAGAGADPYAKGQSAFTAASQDFTSGGLGLYSVVTATRAALKIEAHTLTADGSDPVFDTVTITP